MNPDFEKSDGIYREMLRNEETLIHRKITWLISIHAFIFAGIFFAFTNASDFHFFSNGADSLIYGIAILGLVASVLIESDLIAAVKASKKVKDEWDKIKPDNYAGPGLFAYPPDFKEYMGVLPYLSSVNVLPILFIVMWLMFFFRNYLLFYRFLILVMIIIIIGAFVFWLIIDKKRYSKKINVEIEEKG